MTTLATWVKVNGQGDFLGKVKGQRSKLAVKILDPGRGRKIKNRVYGSDTPLFMNHVVGHVLSISGSHTMYVPGPVQYSIVQ